MAKIAGIFTYPIKGFPSVKLSSTGFAGGGRVQWDREWWFRIRGTDTVINGKWALRAKNRKFFAIRMEFDLQRRSVGLGFDDALCSEELSLDDPHRLSSWMSGTLGVEVELMRDRDRGKPDDFELSSFTLVGYETLVASGQWFGLTAEQMRARLRPNVVVDGLPPFHEYRHLGKLLRVGLSSFEMNQICLRCAVPTADPLTGEITPGFAKRFGEFMAHEIRKHAPEGFRRDPHGYYACINTRPHSLVANSTLRLGDTFIAQSG